MSSLWEVITQEQPHHLVIFILEYTIGFMMITEETIVPRRQRQIVLTLGQVSMCGTLVERSQISPEITYKGSTPGPPLAAWSCSVLTIKILPEPVSEFIARDSMCSVAKLHH